MKYREMLYFIGKCLRLGVDPSGVEEIRALLRSGSVSLEKFVWVGSRQMVLPTLFVRLRDAALLDELPEDLVAHMENIHKVNVKRNQLILGQIEELVELLNKHDMSPVFLKGTAHLLQGLYEDMGERMIGDIDFLLPVDQILPAVELLSRLGYSYPVSIGMDELQMLKHYPRLRNDKVVAALEIHRQPVSAPYDKHFNLELLFPEIDKLDYSGEAYALAPRHQVIHNIMNVQMNDKGYKTGKVFMRQVYDLLLLSRGMDPLDVLADFEYFPRHLQSNLVVASHLLGHPETLPYVKNRFSRRYYRSIHFYLGHPKLHYLIRSLQYVLSRVKRYITWPAKAIYIKEERRALLRRIGKRSWYGNHLKSYRKIRNV